MANRGEIPGAVRLGREWRFRRREIEELIGKTLPEEVKPEGIQ